MARVLIIDDSPTETRRTSDFLIQAGHQVDCAQNGKDGIHMAQSISPDLILMDVVMPDLNGFQATRQLQRDPKTQHIPVIIISTKNQQTDKIWGLRQGAIDYLIKPVQESALIQSITTALND
ncbi:MAG: response regulator [Pseudomonadales bacterium]|nr:response regulator [Pseudomonadales bacterium]